jgi:hypothetical protein
MILCHLKGRGMVSGFLKNKQDAILPHPTPPQALAYIYIFSVIFIDGSFRKNWMS